MVHQTPEPICGTHLHHMQLNRKEIYAAFNSTVMLAAAAHVLRNLELAWTPMG